MHKGWQKRLKDWADGAHSTARDPDAIPPGQLAWWDPAHGAIPMSIPSAIQIRSNQNGEIKPENPAPLFTCLEYDGYLALTDQTISLMHRLTPYDAPGLLLRLPNVGLMHWPPEALAQLRPDMGKGPLNTTHFFIQPESSSRISCPMKSLQYATSHETTEPEAGDVYVALGEGWYVPLALDGLRLDGPKHQPPAARTLLQRVLSHLLSTKNPLTVDLSTLSQTWSMLPGSRLMDAASPEPAGTLYRSLPDGKKLNFQWSDVIPAEARQASTARDIAPSRSQGGLNK